MLCILFFNGHMEYYSCSIYFQWYSCYFVVMCVCVLGNMNISYTLVIPETKITVFIPKNSILSPTCMY